MSETVVQSFDTREEAMEWFNSDNHYAFRYDELHEFPDEAWAKVEAALATEEMLDAALETGSTRIHRDKSNVREQMQENINNIERTWHLHRSCHD